MDITVRQEQKNDRSTVEKVIRKAFEPEPMSDQKEHLLVKKLRDSPAFIPELSLLAEVDNTVVGYILLTKIQIKDATTTFDSLALAPVSVLPDHQRKGIGKMLIRTAHNKAKELGFRSVVLIGHEDYYPKFGYKEAQYFGISFPFEAPAENCMAIELFPDSLAKVSGEVVYPEAFFQ
ncbi:MAG TPA: GNAT family N-acetyltransferase [Balneolaceae bacterium]|nr:GNAT family N-acetyltransferase [Balneolaceae bacterium]